MAVTQASTLEIEQQAQATATNLATFRGEGGVIGVQPGNWSVRSTPAGNTAASASKSAGAAGVRHVCTSISVQVTNASTYANVYLRDGAAGSGTIVWAGIISSAGTGASSMGSLIVSGLNIVGSAATAMVLEMDASAGASSNAACSLTGYDVI